MTKMKKILGAALALSLVVACGTGVKLGLDAASVNADSQSSSGALLDGTLTIGEETASIRIGDTYTVRVTVGERVPLCTWTSSDPNVATVEGNGNVVSQNVGETTITATYGSQSVSCVVTVGTDGYLPVLRFTNIEDGVAQIDTKHSLSLDTEVMFNGKAYTDATVEYALSDKAMGTIEDGVFTPAKMGEVTVTATAEWRGVESFLMETSVDVTVIQSVQAIINDSFEQPNLDLYTIDEWKGVTYGNVAEFAPKLFVAGEPVQLDVKIADEAIAEFNEKNGTITAKRMGETSVTISYREGDVDFTRTYPITVTAPLQTWENQVEYFSAMDGDLVDTKGTNIVNDLFGADNKILAAYQNGIPLDISQEGKILGVSTSATEVTKTSLLIYGEKYAYSVNVSGYTKVMKTAADLAPLNFTAANQKVRGYFFLYNDIDLTVDKSYDTTQMNKGGWSVTETSWFSGTFDGNGKKINGFKSTDKDSSLFGRLEDGIVKNLAMTNVEVGQYARVFAQLSGYTISARYENVFVSVNLPDEQSEFQRLSVFSDRHSSKLTLGNVLVVFDKSLPGLNVTSPGGAGVGMFRFGLKESGNSPTAMNNVYLVAPPAANGRIMPLVQNAAETVYAQNDFAEFDGLHVNFDETTFNPVKADNGTYLISHVAGLKRMNTLQDFFTDQGGATTMGGWDLQSGEPVWVGV